MPFKNTSTTNSGYWPYKGMSRVTEQVWALRGYSIEPNVACATSCVPDMMVKNLVKTKQSGWGSLLSGHRLICTDLKHENQFVASQRLCQKEQSMGRWLSVQSS